MIGVGVSCEQRTGQTQAQLTESADLNRTYVVSVEQGKTERQHGVIIRIASALGGSAEQLLVTG